MRSCFWLVLAVPGMLAAATAADAPRPASTRPATTQADEWGPAADGLQLSLRTEKPRYAPGEPIRLVIVMRNVGEKMAMLRKTPVAEFYYHPEVILPPEAGDDYLEPHGPMAPLTLGGRRWMGAAMSPTDICAQPLRPGEERREYEYNLERSFDMTLNGGYKVDVSRHIDRHDGGHADVMVLSNTLMITIDPAANLPKPDPGR